MRHLSDWGFPNISPWGLCGSHWLSPRRPLPNGLRNGWRHRLRASLSDLDGLRGSALQKLFDLSAEFGIDPSVRWCRLPWQRRTRSGNLGRLGSRSRPRSRCRGLLSSELLHNACNLRDDPDDDKENRQESFKPVEASGEKRCRNRGSAPKWHGGQHGMILPVGSRPLRCRIHRSRHGASSRNALSHLSVSLQVAKFVVVNDAESAAVKRFGNRLGHLRL